MMANLLDLLIEVAVQRVVIVMLRPQSEDGSSVQGKCCKRWFAEERKWREGRDNFHPRQHNQSDPMKPHFEAAKAEPCRVQCRSRSFDFRKAGEGGREDVWDTRRLLEFSGVPNQDTADVCASRRFTLTKPKE